MCTTDTDMVEPYINTVPNRFSSRSTKSDWPQVAIIQSKIGLNASIVIQCE